MAAPNIVGVTTITGKTATAQAVGTGGTNLIANGASSNKVIKVNSLFATNKLTTDTLVTISIVRTTTTYRLVNALTLPVGATLDLLDRAIYLEESDTLKVQAGDSSALDVVASYEEIS